MAAKVVTLQLLTAENFADFGDVLAGPLTPGERAFYSEGLQPDPGDGRISLHVNHVTPARLPYTATQLERHPNTSQTFLPLRVSRYVVLVAATRPDGRPDDGNLKGFWSPGDQGITYHAGVWHHGIVVLDQAAHFAVLMWRRGDGRDDEFADLPAPVGLQL